MYNNTLFILTAICTKSSKNNINWRGFRIDRIKQEYFKIISEDRLRNFKPTLDFSPYLELAIYMKSPKYLMRQSFKGIVQRDLTWVETRLKRSLQ